MMRDHEFWVFENNRACIVKASISEIKMSHVDMNLELASINVNSAGRASNLNFFTPSLMMNHLDLLVESLAAVRTCVGCHVKVKINEIPCTSQAHSKFFRAFLETILKSLILQF